MNREDFLVEIHTEELPPKSLKKLSESFGAYVVEGLQKAGLMFEAKKIFATPRRLAILINQLDASQPDQAIERRGPAFAAAFDATGKPTPACVGFAKSCNTTPDALTTIKTAQGEWVGYLQATKGKAVAELLPTIVKQALSSLPVAKRMRWGASDIEFVRPVHSIIMLYGENIISTEILGLKTGRMTSGHRFLANKEISIFHASDYEQKLENAYVIVDFAKRHQKIGQIAYALAREKFGADAGLEINDSLWDEVTSLVEWPVALCGSFEETFLRVPREALISAMQDHQRYFPITLNNKLLPNFITISNIESNDVARVIHGNERVLRARLSDAAFFYETDKQQKLEDRLKRLKQIVYQAKLGTLYDKAQRISKLAVFIAQKINGDEALAARAGLLAKADLTSNMVGEFPELQGIMGYYYAGYDGENSDVANAIKDHYVPRYAGEPLVKPDAKISMAVALADRIDSLVGAFGINQIPTGDKDPYGLRRAAIGVLRYLIENRLEIDLNDLLIQAEKNYQVKLENTQVASQVLDFINDRLRAWYHEQDISADIFASVAALNISNLYDLHKRIGAVKEFKQLAEADVLSAANKRVSNILKTVDVKEGDVNADLFEHAAEENLAQQLASKSHMLQAVGDYKQALINLAELRPFVDDFFDNVMVMTDDQARRDNRIRLLKQLRGLFLQVADIALLQNEKRLAAVINEE